MSEPPRGRLVVPDPRLVAEYQSLAASTTHCHVVTADGVVYSCLSVNELADLVRHRDRDSYDVKACAQCKPGIQRVTSSGRPQRAPGQYLRRIGGHHPRDVVIKPRLRLVDTEALAHHHKVAPGTIRRWASEDGWHRYGTRRHRLWSMAQAQQSWERRQPPIEGATCA